jgi:hypothetical protein
LGKKKPNTITEQMIEEIMHETSNQESSENKAGSVTPYRYDQYSIAKDSELGRPTNILPQ